jgi:6-phosphofructokinase 1
VIGAATIRARLAGAEVLGIRDGFKWIMQGDISRVAPLTIEAVSRIHFRGGSWIGISRSNPSNDPALLDATVSSLRQLGVTRLITIGGDGTASTANAVQQRCGDTIGVVHVPKTIDDDLALPAYVDTFGYQTARHYGAEIVKNLMVDGRTTSRWYFVVTQGRKAGHLALGIGKAAGATLTLIPEEFPGPVPLTTLVDTLAGAIIKRLAEGRRDGVAVLAEGLALKVRAEDLEGLHDAGREPYGEVRISDINLGEILRVRVAARLAALGLTARIAAKSIGYELRCADPIPFDMEYARDLGASAATHVLAGGHADMIALEGGRFVPIPFASMVDPATGRTRMRFVDVESTRYQIAHRYMIRLRPEDFEGPQLARLAAAAGVDAATFWREFGYLAARPFAVKSSW